MTVDMAVETVREGLMLMLVLSAPILVAAMVIGLAVSLMQAMTQVQEQTLSFVPKIVGMVIVAMLVAPWMTVQIMTFAQRMFAGGEW